MLPHVGKVGADLYIILCMILAPFLSPKFSLRICDPWGLSFKVKHNHLREDEKKEYGYGPCKDHEGKIEQKKEVYTTRVSQYSFNSSFMD